MQNSKINFLHEWLNISDHDIPVTEAFKNKATAFGVDLQQKYFAVLVSQQYHMQVLNIPLAFALDSHRMIYILREYEREELILHQLTSPARVGIGTLHYDLSGTIREAIQALCFTENADKINVARFAKTKQFETILQSNLYYPNVTNVFNSLENLFEDSSLIDTFWTYSTTDHNITKTANRLHIHRKTVEYRLNKLQTLTGFDPHSPFDDVALLTGYLRWRTKDLNTLLVELQSISDKMLPRDKSV